jgi:hypothetical protein
MDLGSLHRSSFAASALLLVHNQSIYQVQLLPNINWSSFAEYGRSSFTLLSRLPHTFWYALPRSVCAVNSILPSSTHLTCSDELCQTRVSLLLNGRV